ncbi:unnamed protein product [Pleuronectes platessa]|uniref:Uncharacterized protein n=1 Tax=Pleuronectes platessa TaxID=8262 RepID=A0A9N7UIX5_PLEPL|nr:unnamed protein product [Pleuronectes platessa]
MDINAETLRPYSDLVVKEVMETVNSTFSASSICVSSEKPIPTRLINPAKVQKMICYACETLKTDAQIKQLDFFKLLLFTSKLQERKPAHPSRLSGGRADGRSCPGALATGPRPVVPASVGLSANKGHAARAAGVGLSADQGTGGVETGTGGTVPSERGPSGIGAPLAVTPAPHAKLGPRSPAPSVRCGRLENVKNQAGATNKSL